MPHNSFKINNTPIKTVDQCAYLGFNIHSNGKLDLLQTTLVHKASRALFSLYKIPGFRYLNITEQLQLFNSLIKPILLYGSEVWGLDPILTSLKHQVDNEKTSILIRAVGWPKK